MPLEPWQYNCGYLGAETTECASYVWTCIMNTESLLQRSVQSDEILIFHFRDFNSPTITIWNLQLRSVKLFNHALSTAQVTLREGECCSKHVKKKWKDVMVSAKLLSHSS
jgi:hypothetical protein